MIKYDNYTLRLFNTIDNSLNLILRNPYLTGIGYGFKRINNKIINIPTLTFLVRKKLPPSQISSNYLIPKYVNGIVTDVLECGTQTLSANEKRPAYSGLSVSNSFNKTLYGTIAYPVTDAVKRTNLYILSCSHVLTSQLEEASTIKDIMQPAVKFKGIPPKPGKKDGSYIGEVTDFTPLNFFSTPYDYKSGMEMDIDAAIAKVGQNTPEIRGRVLAPLLFTSPGDKGPLSILTTTEAKRTNKIWFISCNGPNKKRGQVTVTNALQKAHFNNKMVVFQNQILVEALNESIPFQDGDSGSLGIIDDSSNAAFGMLVCSSSNSAFFTPINRILDKFKVTLVKPGEFAIP